MARFPEMQVWVNSVTLLMNSVGWGAAPQTRLVQYSTLPFLGDMATPPSYRVPQQNWNIPKTSTLGVVVSVFVL